MLYKYNIVCVYINYVAKHLLIEINVKIFELSLNYNIFTYIMFKY